MVDVIIEPAAWARDAGTDTRWAVALTAIVVLRLVSLFAFYRPETSVGKLVAGVVFQILTVTPLLFVLASLLWMSAAVWRVRLAWPVALSIAVHVYFAYTLATIVAASIAGVVLPATADVDVRHPPFTSLDVLVAADQQPLHAILGEFDARVVYAACLAALAIRAAAPSVTRGRVWLVLGMYFVVLVLLEVIRVVART